MFSTRFGIEIEFTGLTKDDAAGIAQQYLGGSVVHRGGPLDTYVVTAPDGREWKFVYDSSIRCQKKENGRTMPAKSKYAVEMVSPILTYYDDINDLQSLVRRFRKAGGITNDTCGIHIHLDGQYHTVVSLKNFINLVASRNDLFYKALKIPPARQNYCKKMDETLVRKINERKPRTMNELKKIWYEGYHETWNRHYHSSRYHFLNLHSYFASSNHTVELRGFNSQLHAGKVRAYVVFSLAMNHQALNQTRALYKKTQSENEKFAMRVYLTRIGLNGEEFKSCRMHLYEHLSGNAAWRYGSKENCRSHRRKPEEQEAEPDNSSPPISRRSYNHDDTGCDDAYPDDYDDDYDYDEDDEINW